MLLTFFLCGFVVEPTNHSRNQRAKKKNENDMG